MTILKQIGREIKWEVLAEEPFALSSLNGYVINLCWPLPLNFPAVASFPGGTAIGRRLLGRCLPLLCVSVASLEWPIRLLPSLCASAAILQYQLLSQLLSLELLEMNKPNQERAGDGKSSCREKNFSPPVSVISLVQCHRPSLRLRLPRCSPTPLPKLQNQLLWLWVKGNSLCFPHNLQWVWFHCPGTTAESWHDQFFLTLLILIYFPSPKSPTSICGLRDGFVPCPTDL